MCGIAGFSWKDELLIKKMTNSMKHRGPDGEGYYLDESISLGHRRLAIIDLTEKAIQPMPNEDRNIWLVYNGEIYNYIELTQELKLKGHTFRSKSDAEVIIHAYEEYDINCLNKFNGMFSFCIYDKRKKILFLARDRFGIKPLYYWANKNKFIFSSEIKAILFSGFIKKQVNNNIVFDYLLFNCYDHLPETFFKDIYRLLPAHYGIYDLNKNEFKIYKWYDLNLNFRYFFSFKKAKEKFLELFIDSIKLRLRSDVEVGSCLSGGLDSSSIICILDKFLLKENQNINFKTFTVAFPGRDIDETPFVEYLKSSTDKINFYYIKPTILDLINDMENLIYYQEEPFGGTSIFAQWEVMKLASLHKMKVLLDGQGGDELLVGYPFLYGYYFIELLLNFDLIKFFKEIFSYKRFQLVDDGLLFPLFLVIPFKLKPLFWDIYFHHCLDKEFIKKYLKDSIIPSLMYKVMDLNKGLYYRIKYGLPLLLREEDKNSMAFSIETRLPFLDYRIVEFLFSLPPYFKVNNGLTKFILRESMKDILPEEIRLRRSKFGFSTPMDDWFRDQAMIDLVRKIIYSKNYEYFDYYKLLKLYQRHIEKKLNMGQTLWKLVNLDLWFKIFMKNFD